MADTHHEVDVTEFRDQSTIELLRSITTDSATLVRKEMELARQEILEGVSARIKAALARPRPGCWR